MGVLLEYSSFHMQPPQPDLSVGMEICISVYSGNQIDYNQLVNKLFSPVPV